MKQWCFRALALALCAALLLPQAGVARAGVSETLDQLIAYEYPEGYVFQQTFDGGSGCFGFAKLVVNRLFGANAGGKIRSWNYAGESTTGMNVLDRLYEGEYSEENIRNMMKKARPGCVIQRNVDASGASQHSMIFLSAGEDSFQIYDCNAGYDNVVHIRSIGYGDWAARTFLCVTLLIPDNYDQNASPSEPDEPHGAPQTEAEITARLSAMMATGLPVGSQYTRGETTEEKNVLFAEDVLLRLFETQHKWSRAGVPLEGMQLVGRVFYGEYEDAARLAELFSQAAPGDVIQLGEGTYDRAHCMIYLSSDAESVTVYDADRSNDGVIRRRTLPYATRFPSGTWQNISLLRAAEHPTALAPQPEPEPKPEDIAFIDVPDGHWARTYIEALVARGVTRGKDPAHFAPDATVTRAELVMFLARMGDIEQLGVGSTELRDIPAGAWYEDAVRWANSHGIARGDAQGYFRPDAAVSREDLAVMLAWFLQVQGRALPAGAEPDCTDASAIAAYARDSVAALGKIGAITGRSTGAFSPKDSATRAECAKILYKSLLYLEEN